MKWSFSQLWRGNAGLIRDLISFEVRNHIIDSYGLGRLCSFKKRYTLEYFDGEHHFKVHFPKERRPREIVKVITQSGQDVTSEILQALGPAHNFHGIRTTPSVLGYSEGLKIHYRNGLVLHCCSQDVIKTHP